MNDSDGVNVLIVEDGDADAEMIARALRSARNPGRALRVRDGVEALDFIFQDAPGQPQPGQLKLILLDLKMPRLGGFDVLKRLRASERTRGIPVVMLTSSGELSDMVESYRLGANSYLVKPLDSGAFAKLIAQAGCYWAVLNQLPGADRSSALL